MSDRGELREEILAFETFWAAYPLKVGKVSASIAFQKTIKKTTLENILATLTLAADTESWRAGVIPTASMWLQQTRRERV